ncbi:hypothetical protein [Rheinheimera mangrovi]|uniref:hypothetical protein n=1 Tax=Rheinheimera mangrovi TaxID=2498451 RepID=UPI000F8F70D2|nr:hypothetical protein [Rheinheimera mangrovi]
MNIIKFSAFVLSIGIASTLQAAPVKETSLSSYTPYATFFGFSDTEAYLHFAQSMEKLKAQQLQPEVDLLALPQVRNALSKNYQDLSAEEQIELKQLLDQRQQELADVLGIQVKDLQPLMNKYLDFSKLQEDLYRKGDSTSSYFVLSADDGEEVERIAVSGQLLASLGGFGSTLMSAGLADMAAARGISQYQEFEVVFSSRETKQIYAYNNFSGATPRSAERQLLPSENDSIE